MKAREDEEVRIKVEAYEKEVAEINKAKAEYISSETSKVEKTTDEKKNVVDNFLTRLSAGYEGDPYIDGEIASILEKQSAKYSDAKWTAKIKTTLGRYSI